MSTRWRNVIRSDDDTLAYSSATDRGQAIGVNRADAGAGIVHIGPASRPGQRRAGPQLQPADALRSATALTLANAAVVLNHEPVVAPSLGYTRTMHHSSLLEPGDLWRPNPDEHPHVVGTIDRFGGRLTLIDQDGQAFHYPRDGLIPTAVADHGPATNRLPRRW
jgi:hypothetical protein